MNYWDRELTCELGSEPSAAQPFLKWAGGKRWLFRRYRHLFPDSVDRLIDPFLGGASSFFSLAPRSAILSDLNEDLIDLYVAIRNDPRRITRSLVHYHHAHCLKFYYSVRAAKPKDTTKKAVWLLYLNRTCWNGLFRVNLRGEFNVPVGTKTKIFTSINELDLAATVLRKARLIASDFEPVIDYANKGDVVFADPPYFEKKDTARFVRYNSNVFSWADQLRLKDALLRANSRGARCFVTNANHSSLFDLYKNCGHLHKLKRHSVVSGSNSGRGEDQEILVEVR